MDSEVLFSWTFDDKKQRSSLWYMIAFTIGIGLIIFGLLTKQYGMSIILLIIAGFYFFLENNSEDTIQVKITDLGIELQDNFYDYSRFHSFQVIYDKKQAVYLRLRLKKSSINILNLRVDTPTISELRPILLNFLPEDPEQDISFIERLIHRLKL